MVDAMIVVGAPNSSNSQRLKEVAERAGCPRAALVQRAADIDWNEFGAIARLGITAGASAPEVLVEEIIGAFAAALRGQRRDRLRRRGGRVLSAAPPAARDPGGGVSVMAVYTDVTADDLTDISQPLRHRRTALLQGHRRGRGEFQFPGAHHRRQLHPHAVRKARGGEAICRSSSALMEHLAARGITCPQPVKNRQGGMLGKLAGRPAAIVTFLDGLWIRRPNPGHCAAVGEALARLHLAGKDFPGKRANALSIDSWRGLYEHAKARGDSVRPGLCAEIAKELDALEKSWPRDLPDGVIHADLFPDNVFFLGDRLSGLIDFYFACTDTLAYDVAVCLNAWCFEPDHSYNVTKGRALLKSYAKVRALSAAERAALPVLARGAAMRFLLTRLVDWLAVPDGALVKPKDPLEYFRKLRFHQSVKSVSDYEQFRQDSMSARSGASPSTPMAPAPAIRVRAAGARSSPSATTKRN